MTERLQIKDLLRRGDPAFWSELVSLTSQARSFEDLFFLSTLRKKALARGVVRRDVPIQGLRLAILGGYSLYPLHELITHLLDSAGLSCELWLGDFDNYVAEVLEIDSALYAFKPTVVILLPGVKRSKYVGSLTDSRELIEHAANEVTTHLTDLCVKINERSGAQVLLGNFSLPGRRDLGAFRSRSLASDWNFRKWVNLQLGLKAPACVNICDLEFLVHRLGALSTEDARAWFETKQPGSPAFLLEMARELCRLTIGLCEPSKKVLVLDLDNTLWGGVVADDGVDGIEIGDTSPRGEAFKAFQNYIMSLKQRGVLLAVCSKNNLDCALGPFAKHPEMVLRKSDFVAFKANWEPKSDNLRQIAADLNVGLDSLVFVDDNPAEIAIVRQFTPAVTTILLESDPANFAEQLQDCGLFEPQSITAEDGMRTKQYQSDAQRQNLLSSVTDMGAYLESLRMEALIAEFSEVDVPRLAQLINKSNQFNLTTRRRTESEVKALIGRQDFICFSVRLQDRFGDHGLISIVIGQIVDESVNIDTWIMSCRVLKRQVEDLALNELVRLALLKKCRALKGTYRRTVKNEMVRDFYPLMGFQTETVTPERGEFSLDLSFYRQHPTPIAILPQKI